VFDTGLSASVFDVGTGVGPGVGLEVAPSVGPGVGFQVADGCPAKKLAPGVGPGVGFEVADGCSVIDGRLAI
jgi:hypothetical protein